MLPLWFRGVIYMALGSMAELIFTGLKDWPRLQGHSQIYVLPLYFFASLLIFEPLYQWLSFYSLWLRAPIYSAIILTIEYLAGRLLDCWIGRCPWHYERSLIYTSAYIRLEYAPLWASIAVLGEIVFAYLTFA